MKNHLLKPQAIRMNPVLESAAQMATSLVRNMAIKRYNPKQRQREIRLLKDSPSLFVTRCQLYREKSAGSVPTIVVGGFVPDATETVEFQRAMLRKHGSIYYINYPRNGFSRSMFDAQLTDLIVDIRHKGQKPMIMGISFGCGLLLDYMRTINEEIHQSIRGLILASPVISNEDLIRSSVDKSDGIRILESNLRKISSADPDNEAHLQKHIERARRCFHALFNAGAENRSLSVRHLSIRLSLIHI